MPSGLSGSFAHDAFWTHYRLPSFACWNRDPKIRFKSLSGGLFSVFAEKIIAKNGVVYGAVFDPYLKRFSREQRLLPAWSR